MNPAPAGMGMVCVEAPQPALLGAGLMTTGGAATAGREIDAAFARVPCYWTLPVPPTYEE